MRRSRKAKNTTGDETMSRRTISTLLSLVALTALTIGAQAQSDFPNQKITIISGLAAGGGADLITRHYASKLQELSGQTVVVVNRPGAGGNLGAGAAAQAKPDGYTLLVAPNVAFAG